MEIYHSVNFSIMSDYEEENKDSWQSNSEEDENSRAAEKDKKARGLEEKYY
jgi:hypothetical protein